MRWILVGLCLFFTITSSWGQGKTKPGIRHFGTQHHLADGGPIADVMMDTDHLIWIVTHGNVLRYDGSEFTYIHDDEVSTGVFYRCHESNTGRKYVVDHLNQVFYIERDSLQAYEFNDTIIKVSNGVLFTDVYLDEHKTMHVSLQRGSKSYFTIDSLGNVAYPLLKANLNLKGFICLLLKQKRYPFTIFSNNTVSDSSYFYVLNEQLAVVSKMSIIPGNSTFPTSIAKLPNGNYLVSSGKGHLLEFNTKGYIREIPFHTPITSLLADTDGGIWVGTGKGIEFYQNGLSAFENPKIFGKGLLGVANEEDFQGGIWVHSHPNGLYRLSHPRFQFHRKKNGSLKSNKILSIEKVENEIYAIERKDAITSINTLTNEMRQIPLPTKNKKVEDMYFDSRDQKLWVGMVGKVLFSTPDGFQELFSQNEHPELSKVHCSCNGRSTYHDYDFTGFCGRYFFHVKSGEIIYQSEEFPFNISALLVEKDTIWVGTEKGVFVQVGQEITDLSKRFEEIKDKVDFIQRFNDQIWIATFSKGIFILGDQRLRAVEHKGNPIRNGAFIQKDSHELWIVSSGAVFTFNTKQEANHSTGTHISVFNSTPSFGEYDFTFDSSMVYWATTNSGIIYTSFDNMKSHELVTPIPSFTKLEVNGIDYPFALDSNDLTYKQNYLQISYTGINYSPIHTEYRYKIQDAEKPWIITKDKRLQFVNLPPGDYTLELQSRLLAQPWSNSKLLKFNIALPFWKTWWFIGLVVLVLSFIIYQITSFRIRLVNRQKSLTIDRLKAEQKALRSKMDHHFVFNVVASLQYLITSGLNEKASQFLEKFSVLMRNTLDQTNQETTPIHQEIKFLTEYLEMEQFRLEGKFDYRFEIEQSLNLNVKILNFLIQPFLENAIQHGLKNMTKKGILVIRLSEHNNYLKCIVEDNGFGYENSLKAKSGKKRKRQHHGISTVEARLAMINGQNGPRNILIEPLNADQLLEPGTRVTLFIKTEA